MPASPPRKKLTEAERKLWSGLRAKRYENLKIKRDVKIGHYVVDFANARAKVVIEVDDGQHANRRTAQIRSLYLNARGYRVLRYWHSDVMKSTDTILFTISEAIAAAKKKKPAAPAREATVQSKKTGK